MPSNPVAIDTKARLPPKECTVMYIERKGENEKQRENGWMEEEDIGKEVGPELECWRRKRR